MARTPKADLQIGLVEENLSGDADLVQAVVAWVKADKKRLALSAATAENKTAQDKVQAMLGDLGKERRIRVGEHVICTNPPGKEQNVAFKRRSKARIRLETPDGDKTA